MFLAVALALTGCGGGSLVGEFQQNAPPTGGPSATIGGGTASVPPPTISNVAPSTGDSSGGTAITITGAAFQAGAIVLVGGKPATNVVVTNASSIQAVTAPNAPGTYEVQVINPDQQSGARLASYTYLAAPAPTLIQVLPNGGPSTGGTVVILSGSNYQSGAIVLFGGAAATNVTLISSAQLQVTTPSVPAGIVDVQVINPDSQSVTLTGGFTFTLGPAPLIVSVLPGTGPSSGGTAVTITGTNFAAGAIVQFGNVTSSNVIVNSATQITVITPPHATGVTDVIVRNPDNQSATRASAFNFVPPPSITSVSPTNGPLAGGTAVTISGSNFQGGAAVAFGGTPAASVTIVSPTQILATTPTHAPGTIDVVVTNVDGQRGTLTGGFTFNLGPAPSITGVAPASGPVAGGTSVVITGTNFQSGASVAFGTVVAATVTVNSATQITAVTPASSAGVVDVTVMNNDGQVGTLSNGFSFLAAPTVAAVSPSAGPTSGGTAVLISGTDFQPGATVQFGSTAATSVTVSSATLIQASSPAGAAGAVSVTVTNPDTQAGALAGGFTYSAAPAVSSVAPSTGPVAGGTTVTITGANFVSGATVRFGTNSATGVVFNSATSITAVTPAGAAGAVSVTVTNPSTQSGTLPLAFTYAPPPAPGITGVIPTSGAASGGTPITIAGSNFQAGATVTIGGTAATGVVVVSATSITAVTPAHAAGTVNVVVTNPGPQSATLFSGYTYNPAPTVGSVVPNSGPTSGGTVVIVNGTNFQTGATILFNSTPATGVVFLGATQYQATTPAQAAGTVSVRVTNPDGQSATLASAFIYTAAPPPIVSSVSPGTGPASGGTPINITGSNFVAGAAVLVGGGAATNVGVSNATSITADTPTHVAGTVSVSVRNPDGQIGTLASSFVFVAAPTISSVSPNSGPTAGGTSITITGTAFDPLATVSIGGISAGNVVVVSATSITAVTPAGSAGAASVSVLNPDGQTALLGGGFSYFTPGPPPTVTSVLPINGSQNGGTTVTITGTGFQSGATVLFGTNAATGVVVNSATSITAVTPAGTPGPAVAVRVTNLDTQFGLLPSAFAYLVSSIAVVTSDLSDGNLQIPYTIGFAGFGGVLPYTWTLSSGTLPPGLVLNANTGFLDGVPTQTGSFSFTILVSDKATPSAQTATANFTLDIVPIPVSPTLPKFPQVFVDTTMPAVNGSTFFATACTGAGVGIQDRINAAKALDGNLTHKIVVTSSLNCNLTLVMPIRTGTNPNGTGWIILESSAIASLPAAGTRMVPAMHAQFMPKINGPSTNNHAMYFERKAHHYRFIGIEFGMATGAVINGPIVAVGTAAGDFILSTADFPHHVVLDRSYIHGQPTVTARRGVGIEANNVAIQDSHISDCHEVGSDSQAIAGWNFQGPLKIVNNYLEGAGENLIFGGSGHVVAGVIPSDIEIRRNYFFKPLTWRVGDPSYAGFAWTIKNSFELKNSQRVLFEGNILEHSWAHAQRGAHILFTPRIECTGVAPSCVPQAVVQDITIRNNRLVSAAQGFSMIGRDSQFLSSVLPDQTNRVWIHDNLLEDINSANWGGDGRIFQAVLYGVPDLRIEHNTGFQDGVLAAIGEDPANYASICPLCPAPYTHDRFIFQNNIFPRGNGGIFGSAKAEGNSSLNFYAPGQTFLKNVIPGANSAIYPTNNFYPAGPMPSDINFVNYNGGLFGDYRLLPTSPYKNQGTDGKDVGAKAGAVVSAVTGVP